MTHIAKLSDLMPAGEPEVGKLESTARSATYWYDECCRLGCELAQAKAGWADAEARFECAERANGDNIKALAKAQADKAALLEACKNAIIHLEQYSPQTPILIDLWAARFEAEAKP